jgi:hypothetical protein
MLLTEARFAAVQRGLGLESKVRVLRTLQDCNPPKATRFWDCNFAISLMANARGFFKKRSRAFGEPDCTIVSENKTSS